MSREVKLPAIPNVDGIKDPIVRAICQRFKERLEVYEGRAGGPDSVVKQRDLAAMGLTYGQITTITAGGGVDTDPPDGPTSLSVTNYVFSNVLSWTNPTDSDLYYTEIWASKNNSSISNAVLIGIATAPTEEWPHTAIDATADYYYWIRAIDTSYNYSIWEPTIVQGGVLVPSGIGGTVNETMTNLLTNDYNTTYKIIADSFEVVQPSNLINAYDAGTTYAISAYCVYGGSYYKSL